MDLKATGSHGSDLPGEEAKCLGYGRDVDQDDRPQGGKGLLPEPARSLIRGLYGAHEIDPEILDQEEGLPAPGRAEPRVREQERAGAQDHGQHGVLKENHSDPPLKAARTCVRS